MTCNECKHMTECGDDAFINGAKFDPDASAQYCTGFEPYTNAERIRAMSDEELADWLARTQIANVAEALEVAKIPYEQEDGIKDEVAKECLEWLKQPAWEESHG